MHTQPPADTDAPRFRGATLDEAIEAAELELGPRVRVLSANHIRRGGIGGFFASDLGVEVCVAVEDETVEEALGRIVEETATHEREHWRDRVDSVGPAASGRLSEPGSDLVPGLLDRPPSARRGLPSFAETLRLIDPHAAPVAAAPHATVLAASIVPAALAPDPPAGPCATIGPNTRVAEPPPVGPEATVATNRSAAVVTRLERLEAAFASLRENPAPTSQVIEVPTRRVAGVPTRRQVELAVAAAEQIIDGIVARGATDRASVRVMMRGSEGTAIEIAADWSGPDSTHAEAVAS